MHKFIQILCSMDFVVESSAVARSGGCFSGTSLVRSERGLLLPLSQLSVGDTVMSFDDITGSLRNDTIIAFLHRAETGTGNTTFVRISVAGGAAVFLTRDHLIYVSSNNNPSADDIRQRFAGQVVRGDYVLSADGNAAVMRREVVGVDAVYSDAGLYAPLTSSGNIVIDDVIASCYAEVTSHRLAHLAMAPLRAVYSFARYFGLQRTATSLGVQSGIHPYAALLRAVANFFLPEVLIL